MSTQQESTYLQVILSLSSTVIILLCKSSIKNLFCEQLSAEQTYLTPSARPSNCAIYKYVGANDLSVNDIVVKSVSGNIVCIKARFSLAIKVEAAVEDAAKSSEISQNVSKILEEEGPVGNERMVLGYLPLDLIVKIEDTCPDMKPVKVEGEPVEKSARLMEEPQDLEMVVVFECGRLAFSFKRENNYYISAIKGAVNLDSNTVRDFNSEKPMFFTSDLTHHFKLNDLVEVNSTDKQKAFILTANFYHLEYEAFRNTSSRNFIRPPDENSKPFLHEK